MPCYDGGDEYRNSVGAEYHANEIKRLSDRNDEVARAACVAFNALEKIAKDKKIPPLDLLRDSTKPCKTYAEVVEALSWWNKHRAEDERECNKRAELAQKEATKKVALSKLTKEERRALQELGL